MVIMHALREDLSCIKREGGAIICMHAWSNYDMIRNISETSSLWNKVYDMAQTNNL